VNRLSKEQIGVILISPSDFEIKLVYDVNTLDVLFVDTLVHEKSERESMRRESISVTDAIKLAKSVTKY
jgi:hypothetical protein